MSNVYDKQWESGQVAYDSVTIIKNYCFSQVAAFAIISLLQTFRRQCAFRIRKKKPVEIRFASLIYRHSKSKKKVNFTL